MNDLLARLGELSLYQRWLVLQELSRSDPAAVARAVQRVTSRPRPEDAGLGWVIREPAA